MTTRTNSPRVAPAAGGAVRRGRPAARVYSVDEVAGVLSVPPGRVLRALELDGAGFLPGSWREESGWRVPAAALRGLLGPGLPRLLTVAEFAGLVGFSVPRVYAWIEAGVVEARRVLGHVRIPETAYWALPAERPASIPARPSFFSGSEEEVEG